MVTLKEFLLARIAEDEAALERDDCQSLGIHVITIPAGERWLAECEAKRRIVELHTNQGGSCGTCTDSDYAGLVDDWPCPTLRALALPYADREEWRP